MVTAIEGELIQEGSMEIVPTQEPTSSMPQPRMQPEPILDEAAVRAAVMAAEASGEDPTRIPRNAVAQVPTPPLPEEPARAETPVGLPEKFKKPNGEADVDKLKAATQALIDANKTKEAKIQKTAQDYLDAYLAEEKAFRESPNPDRMAEELRLRQAAPAAPAPIPPAPVMTTPEQMKAAMLADLDKDPLGTLFRIVEIVTDKKIEPLHRETATTREERRNATIKSNIEEVARNDSRVLDPVVFAAINAKLAAEPALRGLKNPHYQAFLAVKEELRLGEPTGAPAQPSRPSSPTLGGGTPPPTPASSGAPLNYDSVAAAIRSVDTKDPTQMARLEAAAKAYFDRSVR